MPSAEFATPIPAIERPQAYAVEHTSTAIGSGGYNFYILVKQLTLNSFICCGHFNDLMMARTGSRNMQPSV